MENIGPKPRISKEFTDEFKRALTIGLPCMSLEKHGGPPVIPVCKRPGNVYEYFPFTRKLIISMYNRSTIVNETLKRKLS